MRMIRFYRSRVAFVAALLFLIGLSQAIPRYAQAEVAATTHTVTLNARSDARVSSAAPNANFGSDPLSASPPTQSYILFDLSVLPANATITDAQLRLNVVNAQGADLPVNVGIGRVNSAWDEATITDATKPAVTPGAAVNSVGGTGLISWDVTTLVQAWYTGAAPNFGLAVAGPGSGNYALTITSKETGLSPKLTITFDEPDPDGNPYPDFGDAPDSTNNHGLLNTAYPGVNGRFPTVWQGTLAGEPAGPKHTNATFEAVLGDGLSREQGADGGIDDDGANNILDGGADNSNNDRRDDGWRNRNVRFVDCQATTLAVRVSKSPAATRQVMYLNVWFDGERDGDWNGTDICQDSETGLATRSHEWIVQNFVVDMSAIAAGGFVDIPVNTEPVLNSDPAGAHWMRFTLSERPAPTLPSGIADGRGFHPNHARNAYDFGETEDVLYRPQPPGQTGTLVLSKQVDTGDGPVEYGGVVTYQISLKHEGGTEPIAAELRDELNWSLHLVGPVDVIEHAPGVSPLEARITYDRSPIRRVDTIVRWRGTLAPDAEIRLSFPVHVHPLCILGTNVREISNVVQARTLDGNVLEEEVTFDALCPGYSLSDIEVTQELDPNLDDNLNPTLTDRPVVIRTRVTNNSADPVVVGIQAVEEYSDSLAAPDLKDIAAETALTSHGYTGCLTCTRTLRLDPGETRTFRSVTGPHHDGLRLRSAAGRAATAEFDAVPTLRRRLFYCFLTDVDSSCPDPTEYPDAVAEAPPLDIQFTRSDLGDAPASANNFGVPMTAYPTVPPVMAAFPTVFSVPAGTPRGPRHDHPRPVHLGRRVSQEAEADIGPDQDPTNNILPPQDIANRDRADDGVNLNLINLQHCQSTSFPVRVFISPQAQTELLERDIDKLYLNAWADGDRDGKWESETPCPPDQPGPVSALEHIVRDHPIDVATLVPGLNTIIVTADRPLWPPNMAERSAWMRFTLSERESNKPFTAADGTPYGDGRGYAQPFLTGESEDYRWRPNNGADLVIDQRGSWRSVVDTGENRAADMDALRLLARVSHVIDYRNEGSGPAENAELVTTVPPALLPFEIQVVTSNLANNENITEWRLEGNKLFVDLGRIPAGEGGKVVLSWKVEEGESVTDTRSRAATVRPGTYTVSSEISSDNDVDAGNNAAEATVEIGLAPPVITYPPSGTIAEDNFEVRGVAEPGATVEVYANDQLVGTTTADPTTGQFGMTGGWPKTFTLHAVATLEGQTSPPSDPIQIKRVDQSTPLLVVGLLPAGGSSADMVPLVDEDDQAGSSGWTADVIAGRAYTLGARFKCDDPNAQVSLFWGSETVNELKFEPSETVEGLFTAAFTPPAESGNDIIAVLVAGKCTDDVVEYTGQFNVMSAGGRVLGGDPDQPIIVGATVWLIRRSRIFDVSTGEIVWADEARGLSNPQTTGADGAFNFVAPPGVYQLVVIADGYQPFRSAPFQAGGHVGQDVYLEPATDGAAEHVIHITDEGFDPAVATVRPGDTVQWVNLSRNETSAVSEDGAGADLRSAGVNGGFNSGLLAPGESFTATLDAAGTYAYGNAADPLDTAYVLVDDDPTSRIIYLPLIVK